MRTFSPCFLIFSILLLQIGRMPNSRSTLNVNNQVQPAFCQKTAMIILVEFLDINFNTSKDLIEQRASNMRSYFSEVSYNMMSLNVDVSNKTYKLPDNMSVYANSPIALGFVSIVQADSQVNYNYYDYVLVVHAGPSRQMIPDPDQKPKCIETCAFMSGTGLQIKTNEGKIIDSYAVLSEYDGLFLFCHETAHLLGLPDLYSGARSPQGDVGCWDLMGIPTLFQTLGSPPQLSAWSRIRLGWIDSNMIEIVDVGKTQETILLDNLETVPWGQETKVIKVTITSDSYYLLELRNQILSDKDLPSSGILIYRCDESSSDKRSHKIILIDTSIYDFKSTWEQETYSNAAFDTENPVFCDPVNGIAIEVWGFSPMASFVTIYRQQKLHTLGISLPQGGIKVTIGGKDYLSDENGEVAAILPRGNYTTKISPILNASHEIKSVRWSDGSELNPREVQVVSDTSLTCFFSLLEKIHTLIIALPQSGMQVTIDETKHLSDENGEVRVALPSGNHTVKVDLPSSPFYAIASFRWSDSNTSNPRGFQINDDLVLACFYNADYLPFIVSVLAIAFAISLVINILVLLTVRRALSAKS